MEYVVHHARGAEHDIYARFPDLAYAAEYAQANGEHACISGVLAVVVGCVVDDHTDECRSGTYCRDGDTRACECSCHDAEWRLARDRRAQQVARSLDRRYPDSAVWDAAAYGRCFR